MSKSDVATEIRVTPKSLTPSDIKLRECACNHWHCVSPPGVERSRIAEPSFWAVVASQLRQFDEVTVIASDRTSLSRWVVLQAGKNYVEVHCLEWHELPALLASCQEILPSNHRLVFDSATGFSAVRVSDGVVIVRDCDSESECLSRLLAHASLKA